MGAAWSAAVPCTRRIPAHTALTVGSAVGTIGPAARWAMAMEASRRSTVEVLATSASSVRYMATVAGAAGIVTSTPRVAAHAVNSRQSDRYAFLVLAAWAASRYSPARAARVSSDPEPGVVEGYRKGLILARDNRRLSRVRRACGLRRSLHRGFGRSRTETGQGERAHYNERSDGYRRCWSASPGRLRAGSLAQMPPSDRLRVSRPTQVCTSMTLVKGVPE